MNKQMRGGATRHLTSVLKKAKLSDADFSKVMNLWKSRKVKLVRIPRKVSKAIAEIIVDGGRAVVSKNGVWRVRTLESYMTLRHSMLSAASKRRQCQPKV